MSYVKIGPKHQVTIPKQIFNELEFNIGDFVEMTIQRGRVVILPKQITEKIPAPRLSQKEQELLLSAKIKIKAINEDIIASKGLTKDETDIAAKVGLIDNGQKWWWLEEWQKEERKAEEEIHTGKLSDSFESAEELFKQLEN